MARKPPGVAPPVLNPSDVLPRHAAREHTIVLSTITPMFGGSPQPTKVDLSNPVSARTVRGHLRFWWRALNGGRFSSLPQLFQAESRIWGSAASSHGNPSRVDITVNLRNAPELLTGKRRRELRHHDGVAYGGYGLFDSKTPVEGVERFAFEVVATCDDELWETDVAPAIRAWSLLGGVGRRTRRGFGSLRQYHQARALLGVPGDVRHAPRHSLLPTHWLVGPRMSPSEGEDSSKAGEKAWFWILDTFKAQERQGPKPRGRLASPVVVKAVADPRHNTVFWPVACQLKAPATPDRRRIDHVWRELTTAEGLRTLPIGEFPHD
ncbi:type III-B CRISPR module RAMP protein Cmr1 [Arachnia propionica]|uniref:Type III-B CRISPR module RAMP protein Cmr1 n=1 Tax=Arachnia propionica TaxID=1750 RepID=A0A3P1T598_9ACTN|nr:type III-B CRISPR module RAMP protein Cmr1 [Arachnia propionica]RRD04530.1 type III-B CRISPR module RAMP protein Cmr1 [Arachnia propionica]